MMPPPPSSVATRPGHRRIRPGPASSSCSCCSRFIDVGRYVYSTTGLRPGGPRRRPLGIRGAMGLRVPGRRSRRRRARTAPSPSRPVESRPARLRPAVVFTSAQPRVAPVTCSRSPSRAHSASYAGHRQPPSGRRPSPDRPRSSSSEPSEPNVRLSPSSPSVPVAPEGQTPGPVRHLGRGAHPPDRPGHRWWQRLPAAPRQPELGGPWRDGRHQATGRLLRPADGRGGEGVHVDRQRLHRDRDAHDPERLPDRRSARSARGARATSGHGPGRPSSTSDRSRRTTRPRQAPSAAQGPRRDRQRHQEPRATFFLGVSASPPGRSPRSATAITGKLPGAPAASSCPSA